MVLMTIIMIMIVGFNDFIQVPSVPKQDGPCEYTIIWNTPAACPLAKEVESESCSIKDPNSDYVFNLQPLTKKEGFYNVTGGDTTFKVSNILVFYVDSLFMISWDCLSLLGHGFVNHRICMWKGSCLLSTFVDTLRKLAHSIYRDFFQKQKFKILLEKF